MLVSFVKYAASFPKRFRSFAALPIGIATDAEHIFAQHADRVV
jgi:hypothetical protein